QRLRSPKVEKAEILRKAVQFLRAQPLSEPVATEELFLRHYQSGYQECLARATRFLLAIPAEPTSPTPSPMPSCPTPLAASPTDTPRPLGHHGLPAGPGYHSYGGPGLGATHRPGCNLGY
ncbi:HES71 factor, partial [Geococcyx californianus]|nr:HES71 factor [Geococcyx californianus]